MRTLSELIKEKNALPLGNVYRKKINGGEYFYHQYFEAGVAHTKMVSQEEAEELLVAISRRKELEEEIKALRSKSKKVVLSNNAKSLTGDVMSGNAVVARFVEGQLVDMDEALVPLVIKRTKSMEEFLRLRLIDMSRTNARILKRVLGIHVEEDYLLPLYSYALSVSDDYWFRPKQSKLKYHDIRFNNDIYADAALKGDATVFPNFAQLTPEITTTGSFEKGWRLIDGKWWLYKIGNDRQLFSELFCYGFAKLICLPTATYEYEEGYIRSQNFAENLNFEPIASLAGDDDDYERVFDTLIPFGEDILKAYLKMIFFDSVVNNIDRHNENLGLMRERGSGKVVSLAPNFDNNLALIASVSALNPNPAKDQFIKIFVSFLASNEMAMNLFKQISLPVISREEVVAIVNGIPLDIEGSDALVDAVMNRYDYLRNLFNK